LILWDKENVDREGYPNFSIAIGETFKAFFADNIGMTEISFPADDVSFKEAFEKEWKRIAVYTDHLYGFEVIPVFSPEDTFKYLRLPFTNKSLRSLSRQKNYREVMNYISAIATFKPMPDRRIKAYYRQKLCKLFTPLVTAKIKKVIKKKQFALDPQDLQQPLEENLAKLAGQFEFFYSTRKNLENKHQVPAGSLIFPLQNQLVKLGSVSADDQYPFTAYITRQFEKKMRTFFSGDLPSEAAISLDEVIKIDFEEYKPRSELVTNASMEESIYLPDYDAENADGQKLGWKIKTFAGIVKKSVDTLRRWDRLGLIDPIRYEIYSSLQRKKLKYRAYTKNHIEQTRKISEEMRKRQHHQA